VRPKPLATLASPTPAGALAGAILLWATALLFAGARGPGAGHGPPEPPPLYRPDLNSAPRNHLLLLPGIGPLRAAAIVAERARAGPFPAVEALERIKGIGPVTVSRLRDLACVRGGYP
jgi:competence protein ComEA